MIGGGALRTDFSSAGLPPDKRSEEGPKVMIFSRRTFAAAIRD
jgi:hypothetical protein